MSDDLLKYMQAIVTSMQAIAQNTEQSKQSLDEHKQQLLEQLKRIAEYISHLTDDVKKQLYDFLQSIDLQNIINVIDKIDFMNFEKLQLVDPKLISRNIIQMNNFATIFRNMSRNLTKIYNTLSDEGDINKIITAIDSFINLMIDFEKTNKKLMSDPSWQNSTEQRHIISIIDTIVQRISYTVENWDNYNLSLNDPKIKKIIAQSTLIKKCVLTYSNQFWCADEIKIPSNEELSDGLAQAAAPPNFK